MPDSVPVSPAAQAVDGGPPDLWWSPGLAADTFDAQDGVVTEDRGQLYRQQNATWRYIEALPADAVRLVPAPGPDAEAGALKLLAELVELKDGPRDGEYRRRKPRVWQEARDLLATARGEDPLTEHNGDEWFGRRVAKHGPCTCGAGDFDVCLDIGGCALCTALPAGWPCVAEGGYDDGAWVGPAAEAAGVRTDGETPQ